VNGLLEELNAVTTLAAYIPADMSPQRSPAARLYTVRTYTICGATLGYVVVGPGTVRMHLPFRDYGGETKTFVLARRVADWLNVAYAAGERCDVVRPRSSVDEVADSVRWTEFGPVLAGGAR
jgi:hypothetical protein